MTNPWEKISLSDYEKHMSLASRNQTGSEQNNERTV